MERANLPWLPPAPADFRVLLKALDALAHPLEEMVRLASCALDANQLHALNTRLARLASNAAGPLDGLVPIRVAMLSNATTTLLTPCLAATGLRFGFHVTPIEADYDQLLQQAVDPAAAIHGADVVIVALDYRALPELSDEFSEHETEAVDRAIDFVNAMTNGLRANGRARLVVQTVARPPAQLFGNADAVIEGSRTRRIARFNQRLIDAAANAHDIILDVAGLADAVGLDQWFDDVQWHVGKFAFHLRFVPLYADHCMRLIAAAYGRVG